jgi:hypothetical protein
VHDAEIAQLLTRLADDLAPVREHEHGFARAGLLADDLSPDDRLARAGRRDEDDTAATLLDATVKFGDHGALILAQLGGAHAAPDRVRGCRIPAPVPL